ncbi:MAG TPA: hypothetical protein VIZ90_05635 [Rhizobiaceae bacterium]
MIKFIVAAIWICAVTIGAVFYSFQSASAKLNAPPAPPMFGGLDYIKTDIVSVPVLQQGQINGYFLTRLVYTVEPEKVARLSVPAEALIVDQVYSYVYGNPDLDFVSHETLDLDAFRAGVRKKINDKIGEELIHEVLVEQVDFLSKDEIRDNTIRRRMQAGATAREMAKGFKDPPPKPSH